MIYVIQQLRKTEQIYHLKTEKKNTLMEIGLYAKKIVNFQNMIMKHSQQNVCAKLKNFLHLNLILILIKQNY